MDGCRKTGAESAQPQGETRKIGREGGRAGESEWVKKKKGEEVKGRQGPENVYLPRDKEGYKRRPLGGAVTARVPESCILRPPARSIDPPPLQTEMGGGLTWMSKEKIPVSFSPLPCRKKKKKNHRRRLGTEERSSAGGARKSESMPVLKSFKPTIRIRRMPVPSPMTES